MMGTKLRISIDQKQIILQAIEDLIPTLRKGEVSQYEMAAKMIDKEIPVDGISMRCAERALKEKASKSDYKLTRIVHETLAENIKKQRKAFQFQAMRRLAI